MARELDEARLRRLPGEDDIDRIVRAERGENLLRLTLRALPAAHASALVLHAHRVIDHEDDRPARLRLARGTEAAQQRLEKREQQQREERRSQQQQDKVAPAEN